MASSFTASSGHLNERKYYLPGYLTHKSYSQLLRLALIHHHKSRADVLPQHAATGRGEVVYSPSDFLALASSVAETDSKQMRSDAFNVTLRIKTSLN